MIEANERRSHSIILRITIFILFSITAFSSCSFSIQREDKQITSPTPSGVQASSVAQGLYESCAPRDGAICLDRLKKMAEAGFTLVVNYEQLQGSAEQQIAYAEQAHLLGIKIIWGMDNPILWDGTDLRSHFQELASTCNCSDNQDFIRYFIDLVKELPATWGYYIGDEVKPIDHSQFKVFANLVHEIDPAHPRLLVGDASSAAGTASYFSLFADTSEFIADDYYPISVSSLSIAATADRAHAVQSVADKYGKHSAMVLQSFSMAEYPGQSRVCSPFPDCAHFPTKAEMREMRDLAVSNAHLSFILWYSYFDVLQSDDPQGHWEDLIQAANAASAP